MLLAHKIALDPNADQRRYFARASGTARFAWNWARRRWRQEYALRREYCCGPSPSEVWLRRELNAVKREQYPWMYDVTKAAVQEAIIDLGTAFRAFFEKRGRYPRRKRKEDRQSFCAANEAAVKQEEDPGLKEAT
jgi:putative transposase